ncbi:MAG TPA: type ISP restriction/modification enzyme [Leptolyngbya sp.]|jgi:predicted helicase|nr:type ISP restriction/modification enzyme [Leptolyngbya sp.]
MQNLLSENNRKSRIFYFSLKDEQIRDEKIRWFSSAKFDSIPFEHIAPDQKRNWINLTNNDFDRLVPLVDKDVKAGKSEAAIFQLFSSGVKTQRDEWVYGFSKEHLSDRMKYFVDVYEHKRKTSEAIDLDIKWDQELISYLDRGISKKFEEACIQSSLYRPFTKMCLYFDKHFNGRTYQWFNILKEDKQNRFISLPGIGSSKPFQCLSTNEVTCLDFLEKTQCLPLYRYDEDGNRIDNITDWGLQQFQQHYSDTTITKENIFHYTYAVLHNPDYRSKYELNLKREFPRLPFYPDFDRWVNWGKQLMNLHINYETVEPFGLELVEIKTTKTNPKAKLKADKTTGTIYLDDSTQLEGIPTEAWNYKLGNRSALEWILDQYKEKKPKDPTIAAKFNTYRFADYKDQVIDLLQRVCTVSIETLKIIEQLKQANTAPATPAQTKPHKQP